MVQASLAVLIHPLQDTEYSNESDLLAACRRREIRAFEQVYLAHGSRLKSLAFQILGNRQDAEGAIVIPRGSNAKLVIKSATKGGRFRGSSDLVLDLVSVSIEGQQYGLDVSDISMKGRSGIGGNARTGEFMGGGAAVGAIIGAIAGGGKGAAIGAGSGAGAGAVTQILTKGSIKVPAETILTFKLDSRLKVVESR